MTTHAAERTGRIQTVRGLVDPGDLGPTMTHEHLLIDIRCLLEPAPAELGEGWADRPVTPDMRAELIYHPSTNRDDLLLDDEAIAIEEVERYLVQKTLARFEGNVSQAAKALGLSRSGLYRRLQKHEQR